MRAKNFSMYSNMIMVPTTYKKGFFRIMDEDGLVGFADSLGNVIIEPQFKFAYPFKEESQSNFKR